MSRAQPIHGRLALRRRFLQQSPNFFVGSLCASQGNEQIELCSGPEHVADAAENSVDVSETSQPIEIHRRHSRCLQKQFFVVHERHPHQERVASYSQSRIHLKLISAPRGNYGERLQVDSIPVVQSSQFATCLWSSGFCSVCQRNHESLDHIGQFGEWKREPRDDRTDVVLPAEQHDSDDAGDDLDLVDAIEKNFLSIVRVDHVHRGSPNLSSFNPCNLPTFRLHAGALA